MRELLKNILELSIPVVSNDELNKVIEAIFFLKNKSNTDMVVSENNKIQPEINPFLLAVASAYYKKWNDMALLLRRWNKHVSSTWAQLHYSSIAADDLLPLTIKLLPEDVSQLKKIQSHVEFAAQFETTDEVAYLLVNLYSATTYKIESITSKHASKNIDEQYSNDDKIDAVITEIYQQDKINEFRTIFEEYKRHLEEIVEKKIQAKGDQIYQYYYGKTNTNSNHLTVMGKIYIDVREDKSALSDSKELISVTYNYIIAADLVRTLNQKKMDASQILMDFSDLYLEHQATLIENDKTLLGTKILKKIYHNLLVDPVTTLLGLPSKNTKLPSVSGLFSTSVNPSRSGSTKTSPTIHPQITLFKP